MTTTPDSTTEEPRFPLLTRTVTVTLSVACDDDRANALLADQALAQLEYALRGFEVNLQHVAELAGTSAGLLRVEVTG